MINFVGAISEALNSIEDDELKEQHQEPTNKSTKQANAAATLQAVTRGMIARKSFNRIRRQAMASLVIQKTFVDWWIQKSHN